MTGGLTGPLICLVSDRLRVIPPGHASLVRLVEAAARAGVDLIQIRESGLDDRQLLQLTRAAVSAVAGTEARVLLNERTDLALAAAAHGVHLRADSVTSAQVRRIVPPGFVIGQSVHSQVEASAAAGAGADYVTAGTVFRTVSKPASAPLLGLDGLAAVCSSAGTPVLAIGGITADNVENVAWAGASGIAAIGLFADVPTDLTTARLDSTLRGLVARLRAPFLRCRTSG